MFYYLICFAFSSYLFWIGQQVKDKHVWFRLTIYGVALLVPSILAGVRDISVGTDVLVYAYPVFKDAYYAPNFDSLFYQWQRIEVGYLWLNYLVSGITSSHNIFLGLIMFIEVLFVFMTLNRWKEKMPLWLGMLVFYLLFFNLSLNLMRQALALSIAFYGMRYIFNRKFLLCSIWVFIGFLFHKSSIVLVLFYPLFVFANKFRSIKFMFIFILIGVVSISLFQHVLADYMSSLGNYSEYISNYIESIGKESFPYNTLAFYGLLLMLFLCNRKKILFSWGKIGYFFQYLIALIVLIPFLDYYGGVYAHRFYPIVTWWLIILIPSIFYSFDKIRKSILNTSIISYCFFYWYVSTIIQNANETANYLTIFEN